MILNASNSVLLFITYSLLLFLKMSSVMEKDIEVGNSDLDDRQHDEEIVTPKAEEKPSSAIETFAEDESEYITGIRLYLIILGLCMAVLLVGLVDCCCLED
jgi:hypothetical protein